MVLNKLFRVSAGLVLLLMLVIGCSKDSDEKMMPTSKSFTVKIENISPVFQFSSSGVFNTPVGASQPGPLLPGGIYAFEFSAAPGSKLSFATMFVPSNDFFYAPDGIGIELFDGGGMQITGDITAMIKLWDAGSEIDQEPGLGMDQPQRQSGPNTGAVDPTNQVRLAMDSFNNLPAVNEVIKVTLSSLGATRFKLEIENVSSATTLVTSDGGMQPVPLAPGVWVVHSGDDPLFSANMPGYGEGLAALAEDGDPSALTANLQDNTGVPGILAPGIWAVHSAAKPLFTSGQADYGHGLEGLAEDGNPAAIPANLAANTAVKSNGVFNTPLGAGAPGPLVTGNSYEFSFTASPGEMLSFATMFVQSNDLFYAPSDAGLALFEVDGMPISGDITNKIMLWDAGTEVNEEPGIGLNQAPRQSGANTGAAENGSVQPVNDGYSYPSTDSVIKVTITAQ